MAWIDNYAVQLLRQTDPQMADLIYKENEKQNRTLDLIASENDAREPIRVVLGTRLTNKYAEGYSKARFYPGNENIDAIEDLTIERAKELYGLDEEWSVNVQPLSGSPANLAVYIAILGGDDRALGMRLDSGGHLSHGHKVSITGKKFNFEQYGVTDDGFLNYDEIQALAHKHKPKLIVSGYSAYPRDLEYKRLREIADDCDALLMADVSHIAGLIAAGVCNNPFEYVDIVTTTTHKTLGGPRGAMIFSKNIDYADSPLHTKMDEGQSRKLSYWIDRGVFPFLQGGPHMNNIAALGVCLKLANTSEFRRNCEQIVDNSKAMCNDMMQSGYEVLTHGTDNHLFVVDMRNKGTDGIAVQDALERVGILVSKSTVPGDTKPIRPSGIRFGTPTTTTRGMKQKEMREIAYLVDDAIAYRNNKDKADDIRKKTIALCEEFPLS